ncbi:hypothetical protein SMACR_09404 [Sordaria macrospora]|uniref:DUF7587 domain-containing protein n=1 Tax=Sordaria macrospora TaxID=5147 RepID=A0A8S8ZHV4_SORMA|nr:hypothetical protein SMACR_09404 [Sordaria macrospora]KAH7635397.1 hypothetical protein B0T09DRAFT_328682 [Sordaria sp. MPI-SDFR-AT-0083]WPJ67333.1 hypothetical protein SMAC4_09404 [Sordaria macrospora]
MTAPTVFWHLASSDPPVISLTLPPKLYYVRHRSSQAYEAEDGGFISRAPELDIRNEDDLERNARLHFDWNSRDWESCFVSAFGDQAHAEKWALRPCCLKPVKVYELDTTKLPPGTLVLNVFMLCAARGIVYKWNEGKDEYLFYGGIPGLCVGRSWGPATGERPPVEFCKMEFPDQWFKVIYASEQAQRRHKALMAASNCDMETQEFGEEGEHQKPTKMKSVAQLRLERRAEREELKGKKAADAELSANALEPVHDTDVDELSGQMGLLDLEPETEVDAPENGKTESQTTTATEMTTVTAAVSTSTGAATTRTRFSASHYREERRRRLKELESQKSAEANTNTIDESDVDGSAG